MASRPGSGASPQRRVRLAPTGAELQVSQTTSAVGTLPPAAPPQCDGQAEVGSAALGSTAWTSSSVPGHGLCCCPSWTRAVSWWRH